MTKYSILVFLFAFLMSTTTINAVKIRHELTDEEILEVENYIKRDLESKGAYKVNCLLEMTEQGYNIVVINMADPDSVKTAFDPTVVAWYLAHYTQRTDWQSDTLKIWIKPYKDGWGILTKDTRSATAKAEYWFGIADMPTLRKEIEKNLFRLEPIVSSSKTSLRILPWIILSLILVVVFILISNKRIRNLLFAYLKTKARSKEMEISKGVDEVTKIPSDKTKSSKFRKLKWIILAVFCIVIIVLVLFLITSKENPHIKKGKELIAIGKLETASKEFRIVLKDEPRNSKAKGLLYYCTCKSKNQYSTFSDFTKSVYYCSDLEKYKIIDNEEIQELQMEIRNNLYDQGIDTETWDETKQIAKIAAEMAYVREETKETYWGQKFKMFGAAIMGKHGDRRTIDYLSKRLKDDEEFALECLFIIGTKTIDYLKKETQNRESLIRDECNKAIPQLSILIAAKEFSDSNPGMQGLKEDDFEKKIYDTYFEKEKQIMVPAAGTAYNFKSFKARVHQPLYILIPDNRDTEETSNLLYNLGLNPTARNNKYFISIWEWKEDCWHRIKINFTSEKKEDLFFSFAPIVFLNQTKEGYDIITANVEKRTTYKTKYDYSVYPPRPKRIGYVIETIATEEIHLIWSKNELVLKDIEKEDELEEL